ncbi:tryptophan synthase beta chain 2, chloroplastic-like [Solanum lycopersicum]|uniref:tryptophan synthase beta chain 2, chloroplastic-like n=1 Tax=Solanum lycopersicum TaxID=4081 RepID=UPI00374791D0
MKHDWIWPSTAFQAAWDGLVFSDLSVVVMTAGGGSVRPSTYLRRLEYPGVSPELNFFLKDMGRIELSTVTDEEALEAYKRLCRLEGIIQGLEASHAIAFLDKLCYILKNGEKVIINLSGHGDAVFVFNHTPNHE